MVGLWILMPKAFTETTHCCCLYLPTAAAPSSQTVEETKATKGRHRRAHPPTVFHPGKHRLRTPIADCILPPVNVVPAPLVPEWYHAVMQPGNKYVSQKIMLLLTHIFSFHTQDFALLRKLDG